MKIPQLLFFLLYCSAAFADAIELPEISEKTLPILNQQLRELRDAIPSKLRDKDGDTLIQTEESDDEDKIRFDIGGTEQFIVEDGIIKPTTDNDVDLGTDTKQFKNIKISGAVSVDTDAGVSGTYPIYNDGTSGNVTQIVINGGIVTSVTVEP